MPPPVRSSHQVINESFQRSQHDQLAEESQEESFFHPEDLINQIEQLKHRSKSIKKKGAQSYYSKMIPSFTNDKRRKKYFNDPKRGFTYVNWDIEEELWRF